jgi:hypothetical protein
VHLVLRSLLIAALVLGPGACGGDAAPWPDADGVDTAAELSVDPGFHPDADPDCHYDCPCAPTCTNGVETLFACAPMPCSYSTDPKDCETSRTTCPSGCRDVYGFGQLLSTSLEPGTLCRPGAGRSVGDPCSTDADCQPVWATVTEGQVITPYLACDLASSTCVAAPASAPADWLQTACAGPEGGSPYEILYRSTASCQRGICIFRVVESALEQGCSLACTHDGECPQGAVCAVDVAPASSEPVRVPVCVPYAWLPAFE